METKTNQMNVTRTTITREAEKTTANGKYVINYTCVENTLQSVKATVYDVVEREYPNANGEMVKQNDNVRIGELVMEYSMFKVTNAGFPYSDKLPLYMNDFIGIINEIIAPVTETVN